MNFNEAFRQSVNTLNSLALLGPVDLIDQRTPEFVDFFSTAVSLVAPDDWALNATICLPNSPLDPLDPFGGWFLAGCFIEGFLTAILPTGDPLVVSVVVTVGSRASKPGAQPYWVPEMTFTIRNVRVLLLPKHNAAGAFNRFFPHPLQPAGNFGNTVSNSADIGLPPTLPLVLPPGSNLPALSVDSPPRPSEASKTTLLEYFVTDADGTPRAVYTKAGAMDRVRCMLLAT